MLDADIEAAYMEMFQNPNADLMFETLNEKQL
jgi:hypothetical protein